MPTRTKTAGPTPAPEAPAKAPKRPPGRPLAGDRPMTGAERQRALRARQRDAAMTAYGNPQGQPTPAILAALGRLLAQLDDQESTDMHATLRDMAGLALGELAARYKLKLKKSQ